MSQEDFKLEVITQMDNGHYEMPLAFKDERPKLPNNKTCNADFMDDIISPGDAEKVLEDETDNNPARYIPHH